MKLIVVIILPLFFLSDSAVACQAQTLSSVLIDGHTFAVVNLQSSLPEFTPLKESVRSEARSALIPLPDSLGLLFMCFGLDANSRLRYFAFHKRNDGTVAVSECDAFETSTDMVRIICNLRLWHDRQTPFPLEIRIMHLKNQLYFRWILSPPSDPTPSGNPTPDDVLVDVGKPFPNLSLRDLRGKAFFTQSLRSKPSVVTWWDRRCSAFIDELSGLDSLVCIFGSRVGFLAIAHDSVQHVEAFLKDHQLRFSHVLGNDTAIATLGLRFPRTLVLDSNGIIRFDVTGGGTRDVYKEVEKALQNVIPH